MASSRYASVDSHSSTSSHRSDPSPSPSDLKNPTKNFSLKHIITNSSSRRPSADNSSRALARARSGNDLALDRVKNGHNFGTLVKKFMEKKSTAKPGSAERMVLALPVPTDKGKKGGNKTGSNLSVLHRKLFQKGGGSREDRPLALTEVRPNTRTLAMVLRSERELLDQNKEYEEVIQELQLMAEEKDREVEKLKDLCWKQREEIKALKDAILFPDVMNSQLHELLEKQGSELKQARNIIPSLQKQVSSLTGQLQSLFDDLAEVKADKYVSKTSFDEHISSPETPKSHQEAQNSLEYSSGCPIAGYDSPDEMFLKDLNPCLTPRFSKTKFKAADYDQMLGYGSSSKDRSFEGSVELSPDNFSICHNGFLSKSSEICQQPTQGYGTTWKIYRSDESKRLIGKPKHQGQF